jgi:hypothetical protein
MTNDDPTTTTPTVPPPDPPPTAAPTQPAPSTPPSPPPPAWQPPPADHGRNAPMIIGVIILLVGLWYFGTTTLGLDLPRLDWGQSWPLILIAVGGWVVYRSMTRDR